MDNAKASMTTRRVRKRRREREQLQRSSFLLTCSPLSRRLVFLLILLHACLQGFSNGFVTFEFPSNARSALVGLKSSARSHPSATTSTPGHPHDSFNGKDPNFRTAKDLHKRIVSLVKTKKHRKALDHLRLLSTTNFAIQEESGPIFDRSVQFFTSSAFRPNSSREIVLLGIDALTIQLRSNYSSPYNTVPRSSLVEALRAVSLKSRSEMCRRDATVSYRIFQRLLTGHGVRQSGQAPEMNEKEINFLLNTLSNTGMMTLAQRLLNLQERAATTPPLSPVSIAIMLKGYGRLKDSSGIQSVIELASERNIEPDVIMCNSLLDAYVNCGQLENAVESFQRMKVDRRFSRPNTRSYNTLLKGYANDGKLKEALQLAQEMKNHQVWDHVSTNTLVHACIVAGNRTLAASILESSTENTPGNSRQHPNIEAYTELLDSHAKKKGEMNLALDLLRIMRKRGVSPNEQTFTCLLSGFARLGQITKAKTLLASMASRGQQPSVVAYNSLMSSILSPFDPENVSFDELVDETLRILEHMLKSGVRPNPVTISIIVDGLGRCSPVRLNEAKLLVEELERKRVVSRCQPLIMTALIRAHGSAGDVEGAANALHSMGHRQIDTVSLNTFLSSCLRCDAVSAIQTFDDLVLANVVQPDVVSFTLLISHFLGRNSPASRTKAYNLYEKMKGDFGILPDRTLVDFVLKSIINVARTGQVSKTDIRFVVSVLGDASVLHWDEGQLERRKIAVKSVMGEKLRFILSGNEYDRLLDTRDPLFRKKGWNEVNSGFRIWGLAKSPTKKDGFLESKGWNDVDSGFRII